MAMEYKNHRAFPLRLSPSMRQEADVLAQRAGVSLHYFIVLAIVEKLKKDESPSASHHEKLRAASTPEA